MTSCHSGRGIICCKMADKEKHQKIYIRTREKNDCTPDTQLCAILEAAQTGTRSEVLKK